MHARKGLSHFCVYIYEYLIKIPCFVIQKRLICLSCWKCLRKERKTRDLKLRKNRALVKWLYRIRKLIAFSYAPNTTNLKRITISFKSTLTQQVGFFLLNCFRFHAKKVQAVDHLNLTRIIKACLEVSSINAAVISQACLKPAAHYNFQPPIVCSQNLTFLTRTRLSLLRACANIFLMELLYLFFQLPQFVWPVLHVPATRCWPHVEASGRAKWHFWHIPNARRESLRRENSAKVRTVETWFLVAWEIGYKSLC